MPVAIKLFVNVRAARAEATAARKLRGASRVVATFGFGRCVEAADGTKSALSEGLELYGGEERRAARDRETSSAVRTFAVVEAGYAASERLAYAAVEETGIGRADSKTIKNRFGTRGLWRAVRDLRTCGVVREDPASGVTEIADPFGVVAAIIPTTNTQADDRDPEPAKYIA